MYPVLFDSLVRQKSGNKGRKEGKREGGPGGGAISSLALGGSLARCCQEYLKKYASVIQFVH